MPSPLTTTTRWERGAAKALLAEVEGTVGLDEGIARQVEGAKSLRNGGCVQNAGSFGSAIIARLPHAAFYRRAFRRPPTGVPFDLHQPRFARGQ